MEAVQREVKDRYEKEDNEISEKKNKIKALMEEVSRSPEESPPLYLAKLSFLFTKEDVCFSKANS